MAQQSRLENTPKVLAPQPQRPEHWEPERISGELTDNGVYRLNVAAK
jgi:hypothetical protein